MSLVPLGFWGSKYTFLPSGDFPSYGWSFWKRNPNYTGNCIKVFRSSDNTSQDIGFKNNFLDTAAVSSFVGNSNGFVMTFYDQFGSIDLTDSVYPVGTYQGTYVPILVSGGTFISFVNGTPAMQFGDKLLFGGSGTNMLTNTTSTIIYTEESGTSSATHVIGNSNGNSRYSTRDITGAAGVNIFYDSAANENFFINESKEIDGGDSNSTLASSSELYDVMSYKISTQGARIVGSRGIGYNALGTGFSIGMRGNGSGSNSFQGKLNEVFLYNNTSLSESKLREVQGVLNKAHKFYNTTSVNHNLILWYDAGNSSSYPGSGTTITDLSTGGATGTLVGTTYSSSDGGKFVLDAVDDWIGTTGTNNYPWTPRGSDFSIECWVKFSNANHSARIMSYRDNGTGALLSLIGGTITSTATITDSKKISFGMTNADDTRLKFYATVDDIIDGSWKHIIATRTGVTMKIYINGVDKSLTEVHTVGGTNTTYVSAGAFWRVGDAGGGVGGDGGFDISIMRLYKCTLDQVQVTRNFNLEKSRYGL